MADADRPLLDELIQALRCLPGVGPKTAQRMAFHLLEKGRDGALHLTAVLDSALKMIHRCKRCRNFTEEELCRLCASPRRDASLLCIVESPADVLAIEQASVFQGLYFVLHGRLSPLDGVGPAELGLEQLSEQFAGGGLNEIIIATNPTVEGEATAFYLTRLAASAGIRATRIAHGVPLGGELEFTNSSTLAHAFTSRGSVD